MRADGLIKKQLARAHRAADNGTRHSWVGIRADDKCRACGESVFSDAHAYNDEIWLSNQEPKSWK